MMTCHLSEAARADLLRHLVQSVRANLSLADSFGFELVALALSQAAEALDHEISELA